MLSKAIQEFCVESKQGSYVCSYLHVLLFSKSLSAGAGAEM